VCQTSFRHRAKSTDRTDLDSLVADPSVPARHHTDLTAEVRHVLCRPSRLAREGLRDHRHDTRHGEYVMVPRVVGICAFEEVFRLR
jgi:hypothetical protein